MPQKILIIEDNKAHMDALCKILEDITKDIKIYVAYEADTAYKIALQHHIHLFLVDIILDTHKPGDVSGLNFSREIRGISKYKFTPIIFITSLEDPKLYAYGQLHCFSYIEKPFRVSQVRDIILDALEFPIKEDYNKSMFFQKDGIIYSKRMGDIVYIEISRRKMIFHCIDDKLEISYKSSKEILQDLDSRLFIQCSRYSIINKMYIEQIDYTNRYLKLQHVEKPIDVGSTMIKLFKQRINEE